VQKLKGRRESERASGAVVVVMVVNNVENFNGKGKHFFMGF